jgi:hypothetical protein
VVRHRLAVVAHEHAAIRGRAGEDLGIEESAQPGLVRGAEVDRRFATNRGGDDSLVEVGVGLEARPHATLARARRASASFW